MANVQILKVGRALVQGARGTRGGAPSKDSIWGIATVGSNLVTFFGRTGGTLRYKTQPAKQKDAVLELFATKLTKPFKTTGGEPCTYTDVTKTAETVHPGLAEQIGSDFFKAGGRVNRRATYDPKAAARKANARAKAKASKTAAPAAAANDAEASEQKAA